MTFPLQHINDLCRHNNPCFSPAKWPNWPKFYRITPVRRMQSRIITQTPSNKCTSYNTFLAVSIYIFDYKKTKTLPNHLYKSNGMFGDWWCVGHGEGELWLWTDGSGKAEKSGILQKRAVQRIPWGRSILEHSEEQQANQDSWRVADERSSTGQRPKEQTRQMKMLAVL